MSVDELVLLIRLSLKRSKAVEIDGLGVFARDRCGDISFRARSPRIFIAYAVEDAAPAEQLYRAFSAQGFAAWLDRRNLLTRAELATPDRGGDRQFGLLHRVLFATFGPQARGIPGRDPLRAGLRQPVPLDDVFIIPVRLDDCRVPARIQRETQYVDLFPDWHAGLQRVLRMIEN